VARALLLCTLAALPGCALAHNYADAAGPIYLHTEPASPVARPDLHVLTYNIKFGQQLDRAVDLLTWRDGIERPDVLVLQELDAPGVERLARALGMNSVYVPAAIHPASPRDFGVAILSPWPLRDARKILLPHLHRFRKMTRAPQRRRSTRRSAPCVFMPCTSRPRLACRPTSAASRWRRSTPMPRRGPGLS
jgi:hypothetical protein